MGNWKLLFLIGVIIGVTPYIFAIILRYWAGNKNVKMPKTSGIGIPILLALIFAFKDASSATKGGDE